MDRWASVRRELESDVDARSHADGSRTFLDDAYDAASSRSALLPSAPRCSRDSASRPPRRVGLFGQSAEARRSSCGCPTTPTREPGRPVAELGYPPPEHDEGVSAGGPDLLSASGGLTPERPTSSSTTTSTSVIASDQQVVPRGRGGTATATATVPTGSASSPRPSVTRCRRRSTRRVRLRRSGHGSGRHRRPGGAAEFVAAGGTVARPRVRDRRASRGEVRGDGVRRRRFGPCRRRRRAGPRDGPAVGQGHDFADSFRLARPARTGLSCCSTSTPSTASTSSATSPPGPVLFATC